MEADALVMLYVPPGQPEPEQEVCRPRSDAALVLLRHGLIHKDIRSAEDGPNRGRERRIQKEVQTLIAFAAILFIACSLAMWVVLMGKRYGLFAVFFVLSVLSFVLLVLPRAGFSLKTVLAATGVVVASVVIGGANYWLRRRSVGWSMTIWEKLRKSGPKAKD